MRSERADPGQPLRRFDQPLEVRGHPAPFASSRKRRKRRILSSRSLPVSDEALDLLAAYESHKILGPRFRSDMLHIALATVADVDLLVSWNFKHIVRFDKIRLFSAVNLEQGYKALAIHSPREVTTYGADPNASR